MFLEFHVVLTPLSSLRADTLNCIYVGIMHVIYEIYILRSVTYFTIVLVRIVYTTHISYTQNRFIKQYAT